MAEIRLDFRNIGSKNCAVSSPRIVSLEVGDESPGSPSEFVLQGFFPNEHVSIRDVKNDINFAFGCDNQIDTNLFHSQSPLSASTCDERPSDKITNDFDIDLQDLLKSVETSESLESCRENFNSKKNTSNSKMKLISNGEVSDDFSDLLSTIAHEISVKENFEFENCRRNVAEDCEINLLDIVKNECSDPVSSNNSSLKVEGNLSDLLSAINIEDANVIKVKSSNSTNVCFSKFANEHEMDQELCINDFADLLSSIQPKNSNDKNVSSCKLESMYNAKAEETKNDSCLADLLSPIDLDKSNNLTYTNGFSDLLSSICHDSEDRKIGSYVQDKKCDTNDIKRNNDLCLTGLLSSVEIDKSMSTLLNSKPSSYSSSNMLFQDTKDSRKDFIFDEESSSSNSCASSFSDPESNFPNDFLTKNSRKSGKTCDTDSGYNSYDSAEREFSFFDFSSDNQFSFNTLINKISDKNVAMEHELEDNRNKTEEISMSDLLTIVSPEFKNPVLSTLNKAEESKSNADSGNSTLLSLIESLNSKNSDSNVSGSNLDKFKAESMDFDTVDGVISRNVPSHTETAEFQGECSLDKHNIFMDESDNHADDEQTAFIDLRECIKSAKNPSPHTSPIKQIKSVEIPSFECCSPNKVLFFCKEKSISDLCQNNSNPFEFNDTDTMKRSRVNINQTLFSKALACKPKKDESLLQKVAAIKHELFKSIICRPVLIDCDVPQPTVEPVLQSDRCILTNFGRSNFGLEMPCELQ